ncbi:MAG: hypothetical protein KIT42_09920 [Rhodocyclaceae bacterium]|nr:hypothetical protein [Rhodocyclaceae bacterium]
MAELLAAAELAGSHKETTFNFLALVSASPVGSEFVLPWADFQDLETHPGAL